MGKLINIKKLMIFLILLISLIFLFSGCSAVEAVRSNNSEEFNNFIKEKQSKTNDPLLRDYLEKYKRNDDFSIWPAVGDGIMLVDYVFYSLIPESEISEINDNGRIATLGSLALTHATGIGIHYLIHSDDFEIDKEKEYQSILNEYDYQRDVYGKWLPYYLEKKIVLGMPDWIVRKIEGSPDKVTKEVSKSGEKEIWTYNNPSYYLRYSYYTEKTYVMTSYNPLYLYFENGELESWKEVN
jgi:hypothetical protein